MWDEITYPFPNFNGATIEVWEWPSNFIPYFTGHMITYPCWDYSVSKRGPWDFDSLWIIGPMTPHQSQAYVRFCQASWWKLCGIKQYLFTVETPYSTIPYTTIFYITRWTHGPQNLQRPIRTLIVLLGFFIKTNLRVIFVCLLPALSTLNEPTGGSLPVSTITAGPITSDFHTLRPFPLESIIISGVFTKD